jgi:hypothetical protein
MVCAEAATGDESHLCGFIYRGRIQPPVSKEALQVTGTMSQFENASPFEVGENAEDPVIPFTEGNNPRHKIIREGEGMVELVEEKTHEAAHGEIK